jgi:hypothetical protein
MSAETLALLRTTRRGSLSGDQFKPFRTGAFLEHLEPGVRRGRILGLELNVAERQGGFEL